MKEKDEEEDLEKERRVEMRNEKDLKMIEMKEGLTREQD